MTDSSRLIQAASEGDGVAVDVLLERNLPGLRAYIRLNAGQLVRAKESCSDLVQSVCREVLQDVGGFEYQGEAAFRQWLYTAALRKVMDKHRFYKQQKRDAAKEVAAPGTESSPGDLLDQYGGFYTPSHDAAMKEELERVEGAFDELPDDYREVITLARIVGLPHKEIAEKMGRTEVATRHLLARAMARLAGILDG